MPIICSRGEAESKVAARPGHWYHTKRALKEGTNGLSTRDVTTIDVELAFLKG
jgi:hypothetical protein